MTDLTSKTPSPLRSDTFLGKVVGGSTLDQWNCEQQSAWDDRNRQFAHPEQFPNGLVCPQDGGKLYDTLQKFLPTMGSPAKLRVKCQNSDCDFRGERLERVNRITD